MRVFRTENSKLPTHHAEEWHVEEDCRCELIPTPGHGPMDDLAEGFAALEALNLRVQGLQIPAERQEEYEAVFLDYQQQDPDHPTHLWGAAICYTVKVQQITLVGSPFMGVHQREVTLMRSDPAGCL